jgi:inner membrane protein
MDNLTHSLVGLTSAKAGLERLSPYATVVCVVSANAADADVASGLFGDRWTLLQHHRGITHSIAGTIAIGLLIPTLALAIERGASAIAKRKPRIHFRGLLLASMIAAATHPILDWTNNYGVRPFLPWSGRWFYGDLVFIADPYIWVLLGIPAFFLTSHTKIRMMGWGALAVCVAALLGFAGRSPNVEGAPLRIALIIWILVAVTAAWWRARGAHARFGPKLAVIGLLQVVGYWGVLGIAHHLAATNAGTIAQNVAADRGERFIRVAAMPTAASASRWQAVAETDQAMYRFMVGTGDLTGAEPGDQSMTRFVKPKGPAEALVKTAEQDRRAQTLLDFARFPIADVEPDNCVRQTLVQFADLRYTEPGRERGNFSVKIAVDCPSR